MATYVNDLRLKEIGTGESSGTWGTETNTNLELIGEALGYATEGITTNADTHATTVADGSTDPGRAMYIKYTGTLDSACTITIGPNTMSRVHMIENATSGSQNIIISQGSGANVTIPNGFVKAVYLDGAGSGAAVTEAFADLSIGPNLRIGNAAAEDTSVVFDGNAKDFYIGLDDSADKLVIGEGSTVGTNNILTITDDTVTIGDGAAVDTAIVFDGNAQDFYIGLDDSTDDLVFGKGSTLGTTQAMAIDENMDVAFGPTTNVTITNDGNEDTLQLVSTDTDANAGPVLDFNRPVTGADDDVLGKITFSALDDGNNAVDYAYIATNIKDASDAAEDGLLDFQVMSAGTSRSFLILNGGGTVIVNQDSQDIDFRVESDSSTHALFVDAGLDRVGINDSTPAEKLSVGGAIVAEGDHATGVNAMGASAGILMHATGDTAYVTATSSGNNNRYLQLRALNAGSANANQLFLSYTGNVGIGNNSPDTLLDIEYSASNHTSGIHLSNKQGGGYGSRICFNSTRSDNSALEIAGAIRVEGQTAWDSNANENSQLVFSIDGASTLSDRMFLNYRGALKVRAGDSLATFASGTDYTHEIWQDQAGYATCKLATSGGTTNQYGVMFDFADNVENTSNWFLRCMADTDTRLYIYSNGNIYNKTGTGIQQSSDRRLKDNIADYSGGLGVLNSLTPRTYTWKEGQGTAGTQYGFVAQEIEEASEVEDNMNLFSIVVPTREDDENPLQPDNRQYNTQLNAKDALYISAIQELSKEIETLKTEVAALKGA